VSRKSHSSLRAHRIAQRISKIGSASNQVVLTENSVRSENAEVMIIRGIMVASTMSSVLIARFALVASSFRARAALQAEILALRHQLAVLHKNAPRRVRLQPCDRLLWVLWSRFWSDWRPCLQMVQPDTVVRWHCRAFAWYGPGNRDAAPEDRRSQRRFAISFGA